LLENQVLVLTNMHIGKRMGLRVCLEVKKGKIGSQSIT
jgi:hypothetical protein